MEHLHELAERYEEQLFAILDDTENMSEGGAGEGEGGSANGGGVGGFDPAAFEDEMEGLSGKMKKKGEGDA